MPNFPSLIDIKPITVQNKNYSCIHMNSFTNNWNGTYLPFIDEVVEDGKGKEEACFHFNARFRAQTQSFYWR